MTRILPLFLGALVLAASLFSCKGKPHDPANLVAIDSMQVQVDSLVQRLNAIDAGVYDRMDSVFRTQKDRLEVAMKDTLDRRKAFAAGNYYRAMAKSLGRVRSIPPELGDELGLMKKQLEDLRHDVSNGLLDETLERNYVQQERLALADIQARTIVLMNSVGTVQRNWDEHHLLVDSLLATPAPSPLP